MMFKSMGAALTVVVFFTASVYGSAEYYRAQGYISSAALFGRQGEECPAAQTMCADGNGCCPIGAACTYSNNVPLCAEDCGVDAITCDSGFCCNSGYACPAVSTDLCSPVTNPVVNPTPTFGFSLPQTTPLAIPTPTTDLLNPSSQEGGITPTTPFATPIPSTAPLNPSSEEGGIGGSASPSAAPSSVTSSPSFIGGVPTPSAASEPTSNAHSTGTAASSGQAPFSTGLAAQKPVALGLGLFGLGLGLIVNRLG